MCNYRNQQSQSYDKLLNHKATVTTKLENFLFSYLQYSKNVSFLLLVLRHHTYLLYLLKIVGVLIDKGNGFSMQMWKNNYKSFYVKKDYVFIVLDDSQHTFYISLLLQRHKANDNIIILLEESLWAATCSGESSSLCPLQWAVTMHVFQ